MALHCKPHINGNTRGDFAEIGVRLSNAIGLVRRELVNMAAGPLHGRNYQHLEHDVWMAHQRQDVAKVRLAHDRLAELEAIAVDLIRNSGLTGPDLTAAIDRAENEGE